MAPQPIYGKSDLPHSLSHYTNLPGLVGIVNDSEMWASNVSFLNDRRELLYGLDAAAKVVKSLSSREKFNAWRKPLDKAIARLKSGRIPNTYALCFCEKSDLLSQWRGYGGSEQGISIVFDTNKLVDSLSKGHFKASLFPVIYGQLDAKSEIKYALTEKVAEFEASESDADDDRVEIAQSFLSELLPQFKHIGFQEEQEWRIVVQHKTIRSSVHFRAKTNVLIPYLKLRIGENGQIPIKYIRIGPGREQELTRKSVELYLSSKSYNNVEIRVSSVPYRF